MIGSRTIFAWMPWSAWLQIDKDAAAVEFFIESLRHDIAERWPDYRLESETPRHWGDGGLTSPMSGEAVWVAERV